MAGCGAPSVGSQAAGWKWETSDEHKQRVERCEEATKHGAPACPPDTGPQRVPADAQYAVRQESPQERCEEATKHGAPACPAGASPQPQAHAVLRQMSPKERCEEATKHGAPACPP